MIRIYNAAEKNMDELVSLRLEMLREVNGLAEDYSFSEKFIADSRAYFENGDQTTLIAVDGEAVACASICYVNVMPTFEHQTGKRAYIVNVYTKNDFRKQGIASTLVYMLTEQAKEKGVTEITVDATKEGEGLYYKSGFLKNEQAMTMNIPRLLRLNIEKAERTGCKTQCCCDHE